MIKIIHLLLAISINIVPSIAQKEDSYWYFGNQTGINFNNGSPVSLSNGAMFTYDNASTISDSAGNLLFYTDGVSVWNKMHQQMVNGSGLNGTNNSGQSAIIIPRPGSSEYYIFYFRDFGLGPLYFAVVDLSQQGGLGSVTLKNAMLYSNSTEKLAAIYNCNDDSYWLISHKYNSDEFYIYKINSSGLNLVPVISPLGISHSGGPTSNLNNSAGQLSISPDGSVLASVLYFTGKLELFDFNMATGSVSNARLIASPTHPWGVEFSGDNSKLYLSQWTTSPITQFDLSSGIVSTITASATIVGNVTGSGSYHAGYMQRGPDNKIYVARWNTNYIAQIDSPNVQGLNCNILNNGVHLGNGLCYAGLSRTPRRECLTTTVMENSIPDEWKLISDPANNRIIFAVPERFKNRKFRAEILDPLGRCLNKKIFSGNQECILSTSCLSNGYYIVIMDCESDILKRKIIIFK